LLRDSPLVLAEPPAVVRVASLGTRAIAISVEPWTSVDDHATAGGVIRAGIVDAFRRNDIAIPVTRAETTGDALDANPDGSEFKR